MADTPTAAPQAPAVVGFNLPAIAPYAIGAGVAIWLLPRPLKWAGALGALWLFHRNQAVIAQVVATAAQPAPVHSEQSILNRVQTLINNIDTSAEAAIN
jgi:hypothetical protein